MGLQLEVKTYMQDTPNYIINAQCVVIIIQVNSNGKPEADIKTAKFPDKEAIIFHTCLTSCSSTVGGNVEYTIGGTRELLVLYFSFFHSMVQEGTARNQCQNRFTTPSQ